MKMQLKDKLFIYCNRKLNEIENDKEYLNHKVRYQANDSLDMYEIMRADIRLQCINEVICEVLDILIYSAKQFKYLLPLIIQNIHFVQLGRNEYVPYVRDRLNRLDNNMDRIKGYLYSALLRLASLSRAERRRYLLDASNKFYKNMKYNELRDEFDDLPVSDLAHRVFNMVG